MLPPATRASQNCLSVPVGIAAKLKLRSTQPQLVRNRPQDSGEKMAGSQPSGFLTLKGSSSTGRGAVTVVRGIQPDKRNLFGARRARDEHAPDTKSKWEQKRTRTRRRRRRSLQKRHYPPDNRAVSVARASWPRFTTLSKPLALQSSRRSFTDFVERSSDDEASDDGKHNGRAA